MTGAYERAMHLHLHGLRPTPGEAAEGARVRSATRAALGEPAFAEAVAVGRAMALTEASELVGEAADALGRPV